MDLALTKNGDILLEEISKQSHEVGFNFFIKPNAHAICLKFDIATDGYYKPHEGMLITFEIRKKEELYSAIILDEKAMFTQLCYNAIRTQKNTLVQAQDYGSELYLETNKKITNERLEHMAYLAKQAISSFMPEATVVATAKSTDNGACNICFEIHMLAHTLTLDYLI